MCSALPPLRECVKVSRAGAMDGYEPPHCCWKWNRDLLWQYQVVLLTTSAPAVYLSNRGLRSGCSGALWSSILEGRGRQASEFKHSLIYKSRPVTQKNCLKQTQNTKQKPRKAQILIFNYMYVWFYLCRLYACECSGWQARKGRFPIP